jgi:hypothetical protein
MSRSSPPKSCPLQWTKTLQQRGTHPLLPCRAVLLLLLLFIATMGLAATLGVGRWCSSRLQTGWERW